MESHKFGKNSDGDPRSGPGMTRKQAVMRSPVGAGDDEKQAVMGSPVGAGDDEETDNTNHHA